MRVATWHCGRSTWRTIAAFAAVAGVVAFGAYASYRIVRHFFFPQHAAPVVFHSACKDHTLIGPVLAHPIIAFGDSITWGYGSSYDCVPEFDRRVAPLRDHLPRREDTSYPADLSRLLHVSVLNFGVAGERTDTGIRRFRAMLHQARPSHVVVLEGINDLLQTRPVWSVVTHLQSMVEAAQAAHAQPILVTLTPIDLPQPNPVNPEIQRTNRVIRGLGKRMDVPVVDAYTAFRAVEPPSAVYQHADGQNDHLHPNDTGYRLLAWVIAEAIARGR